VANQPIYVIFVGHHSCCKSKLSDAIQPDAANTRIHINTALVCGTVDIRFPGP
jgi:hypothetical protein